MATQFMRLLGNRPAMRIFDLLASRAPMNFTKSQIIQELDMSRRTLYSSWGLIEEFELVKTISSDNKCRFYVLNKENQLVKELLKIKQMTEGRAANSREGSLP